MIQKWSTISGKNSGEEQTQPRAQGLLAFQYRTLMITSKEFCKNVPRVRNRSYKGFSERVHAILK